MFEEQIAAGMRLLDERKPGWEREIDLNILRMSSCHQCVLGQIYGNYFETATSMELGEEYGFTLPFLPMLRDLPKRTAMWETLTQEWKSAIEERISHVNSAG